MSRADIALKMLRRAIDLEFYWVRRIGDPRGLTAWRKARDHAKRRRAIYAEAIDVHLRRELGAEWREFDKRRRTRVARPNPKAPKP